VVRCCGAERGVRAVRSVLVKKGEKD